jgi:hypothetical protein
MSKKPIISIIIPCFNAEKYIKNCLSSILKSNFSGLEVIVVDDGSTDSSRNMLASLAKQVETGRYMSRNSGTKQMEINGNISRSMFRPEGAYFAKHVSFKVIFNNQNLGAAKSRNIGTKIAQGKYIFFLDADTQIEKGFLKAILSAFKKDSKIAAIQAKLLLGKTGKVDAIGHFLSPFGFPYEIGHGEPEKKYQEGKIIFAGRTAALAVRKKVFEKIGGFDKDYLIYGEDTDLCWRIWLAGYQVYYLPQAKVYHFPKSSLTEKTNYRIFYEGVKNNTSNILKNAPLKILVWMFPLHILGWVILSLKLILQGRFRSAIWIYKGLGWNLKNINKILRKRRKVASYTTENNKCSQIMFGKIGFKNFFLKGLKWFKNV